VIPSTAHTNCTHPAFYCSLRIRKPTPVPAGLRRLQSLLIARRRLWVSTFSVEPPPSPQRVPAHIISPSPPHPIIPTTDHTIFAVYHRDSAATIIPDSGATHILIRESDADILHSATPYPPYTGRPQFEVASRQFISPIATGVLHFPDSAVITQAYVFRDTDLADNLFGIASLLQQRYTDSAFTIYSPHYVLRLYGSKASLSNTWRFSPTARSLSTHHIMSCCTVPNLRSPIHGDSYFRNIRNVACRRSFGTNDTPSWFSLPMLRLNHPHSDLTFRNAVHRGWLHNYSNLTRVRVRVRVVRPQLLDWLTIPLSKSVARSSTCVFTRFATVSIK
jgi:hypothetical protein